jgi:hypothetical protein
VRILAAIPLALLVVGCGGLYDWGSYENSVYRFCAEPEDYSHASDIRRLSREIERTKSRGELVPPGKHLHLGYLCHEAGDRDVAVKHLQAEKKLYPESASLVHWMLEGMK